MGVGLSASPARLDMLPIVPDVSTADVLSALDRICASAQFINAPQLQRFLRFIVTALLEGNAASIKGYTIGVGALGRPSDFDPDKNSIVRVEAARLRRALDEYYSENGHEDAIRIVLPVGQYVPVFQQHHAAKLPGEDDGLNQNQVPAWQIWRSPGSRHTMLTVMTTILVMAILEILIDVDRPLHLAVRWIEDQQQALISHHLNEKTPVQGRGFR